MPHGLGATFGAGAVGTQLPPNYHTIGNDNVGPGGLASRSPGRYSSCVRSYRVFGGGWPGSYEVYPLAAGYPPQIIPHVSRLPSCLTRKEANLRWFGDEDFCLITQAFLALFLRTPSKPPSRPALTWQSRLRCRNI
jgi:hypothetical protein